ncbi:MAG: YbfB/YjiJ family MFS transporter, partial [Thauera sp.]
MPLNGRADDLNFEEPHSHDVHAGYGNDAGHDVAPGAGSRNRRHYVPSVPRSESNLAMEPHSSSSLSPRSIVFIGLVALAIAMGIGRFAFTPMMPLMGRDGSLDAVTGTEWA